MARDALSPSSPPSSSWSSDSKHRDDAAPAPAPAPAPASGPAASPLDPRATPTPTTFSTGGLRDALAATDAAIDADPSEAFAEADGAAIATRVAGIAEAGSGAFDAADDAGDTGGGRDGSSNDDAHGSRDPADSSLRGSAARQFAFKRLPSTVSPEGTAPDGPQPASMDDLPPPELVAAMADPAAPHVTFGSSTGDSSGPGTADMPSAGAASGAGTGSAARSSERATGADVGSDTREASGSERVAVGVDEGGGGSGAVGSRSATSADASRVPEPRKRDRREAKGGDKPRERDVRKAHHRHRFRAGLKPPKRVPADYHVVQFGSFAFCVKKRYQNLAPIGKGAYGVVCSADDAVTGDRVAIKCIPNVFRDATDAKRVLREVKLMQHFAGNGHVVRLVDMMTGPPDRPDDFEALYIVSNLFACDMERLIHSPQVLTNVHLQYFMLQLFRALSFVHSAFVLHRDIKPSNVLVTNTCDIAVADFGLARGVSEESYERGGLTTYVVTRWYRAPELLCGSRQYGPPVDAWSAGCVMAELMSRRPLMQGSSTRQQLQLVIKLVGTPSASALSRITDENARQAIEAMGTRVPMDLAAMLPGCDPQAVDLLGRLLVFDPRERISVDDALRHPFLAELNRRAPPLPEVPVFDFSFESELEGAHDPTALLRRQIMSVVAAMEHEDAKHAEPRSYAGAGASSSKEGDGDAYGAGTGDGDDVAAAELALGTSDRGDSRHYDAVMGPPPTSGGGTDAASVGGRAKVLTRSNAGTSFVESMVSHPEATRLRSSVSSMSSIGDVTPRAKRLK